MLGSQIETVYNQQSHVVQSNENRLQRGQGKLATKATVSHSTEIKYSMGRRRKSNVFVFNHFINLKRSVQRDFALLQSKDLV